MRAHKKQVQPRSGPERAFGDVLRFNRRAKGFSQEEFAFETGLDRTTISLMERGLLSPSLRSLVRICRVLRLDLAEFARQIEKSKYF